MNLMKKSTEKIASAVVLALCAGIAVGVAEPGQRWTPQPAHQDVQGMMEAYILSKLQDALDLTDEQFGQMVVAQTKLSDTRRDYRQNRMRVLRQMRQILQNEEAGEDELQPLLDELEALRDEFLSDEKRRYQAIDSILDVRQQARYRILEVELQRRLQEMMRRVQGRRDDRRPREFP